MIKFQKLHENAELPTKAYFTDIGYDLKAVSMKRQKNYIEYDTGIAVELPAHYFCILAPRSSATEKDLVLGNSFGLIDPDYRGSLKFRYKLVLDFIKLYDMIMYSDLYKGKTLDYIIDNEFDIFHIGDKIGQLVIFKDESFPYWKFVNQLSKTNRGNKGFGSSG